MSLDIGAGELVCVVGPNGAGKTTLINAIAGLHRASKGRTITMDGRDLTSVAAAPLLPRRASRSCPEGRRLFTRMTVRENLEIGSYAPAARKARARIDRARLHAVPRRARQARRARRRSLSGGQQQMVAIGRALMAQPRLLLLDEPSLGLSPMIVQVMFGAIRDVNAARHRRCCSSSRTSPMALDIADRAYLLEEGRIVAEGAPDAVFDNPRCGAPTWVRSTGP